MVNPELERGRFAALEDEEGEGDLTEEEARQATERLRAEQRNDGLGEDSPIEVINDRGFDPELAAENAEEDGSDGEN